MKIIIHWNFQIENSNNKTSNFDITKLLFKYNVTTLNKLYEYIKKITFNEACYNSEGLNISYYIIDLQEKLNSFVSNISTLLEGKIKIHIELVKTIYRHY
ncbi:hypothetical protein H8356DRAFT_1330918 [Neocallimastix lanati (nom. inval.)]|nr:hypothetical protein H8356DRAFT_1330918 [Neocallimastix sp. JGI-2020a]